MGRSCRALKVERLWSSEEPESLIGIAMRRCYTTKVWEDLQKDVSSPGYSAYLVESAFRRLEFDVYEHVRSLFSVEGTSDELLDLVQAHPHVAFSRVGRERFLVSLNLRTMTEMARGLGCQRAECGGFHEFIPVISPTVSHCLATDQAEKPFAGEKPGSAGNSESDFRVIVAQHLTLDRVGEMAGTALPMSELLKHSFATVEVEGISRACSHQLVRHRLFSYSQESQRFSDAVNESGVIPPSFQSDEKAVGTFLEQLGRSKKAYSDLRSLGIKKEDARFILPTALKTKILMTGSMFQLVHAAFYRSSFSEVGNKAQWEINGLFTNLYGRLREGDPRLPERIAET